MNNVVEGNLLKINVVGADSDFQWNKSWVYISHFDATNVYLANQGQPFSENAWDLNPVPMVIADFQIGGVPSATKPLIITALSTVIGC
jgi:hypothetical protein